MCKVPTHCDDTLSPFDRIIIIICLSKSIHRLIIPQRLFTDCWWRSDKLSYSPSLLSWKVKIAFTTIFIIVIRSIWLNYLRGGCPR